MTKELKAAGFINPNQEVLANFNNKTISSTEKLLAQRVEALEERLEQMRLSRRVLLRILEQSELDRKTEVARLQVENSRLQKQNSTFAHSLMEKNQTIVSLQKVSRLSDSI